MVGSHAMTFLLFPALALILLGLVVVRALQAFTRTNALKQALIVLACVVGAAYLVSTTWHHIADFKSIRGVTQESLAEVRVGDRVIRSPQELDAICATLKRTEWFESRHGGWDAEVPFVLTMKDGGQYTFAVAYYKTHPGAVILHRIGSNRSYVLGDVGFNSELPSVLLGMGVKLPGY